MRISFFGTGLMGTGFVEALLGRGHDVTVWNRTAGKARALESAGARVAATPAAAAEGAERIYLSLSDDQSVDDVLAAALAAAPADVPVVDFTTTAPLPTAARGAKLAAAGRPYLHAPVFMMPEHARKSQGMMLGAGPAELNAKLEKELQSMTGAYVYLGPDLRRAAAFKLFGNSMFFAITAGLADVFEMARNVDITPQEAVEFLVKLSPGRTIEVRGAKMARGDFNATFELSMARKDTRLAVETAGGAKLAVLPAIAARMDELIAAGHGADDLGIIGKGSR